MKRMHNNLRLTVILALMCAISIVMGKYLAIRGGDILRFSFENLPIIFAGFAFGPISGMLVGVVADLVGCIMVGYTINPLVTLGGAAIGLISGLVPYFLRQSKIKPELSLAIALTLAHLVGSVVIKTFGLSVFYNMPIFMLMLWRLLNYLIVGGAEYIMLVILIKNKGIALQLAQLKGEKK